MYYWRTAVTWVAAAIIGAGALSAGAGAYASDRAADAAARGNQAGIAEQQRQFDTILRLQQPGIVTGTGALNKIAQLLGIPYQQYAPPDTPSGGSRFAGGGTKFNASQVLKLIKQGYDVDEIGDMGYLGGRLNPRKVKKLTGKGGLSLDDIGRLQSGEAGTTIDNDTGEIITPTGPDMSVFTASPDYLFRQREGQAAIDRGAAARGGALSGNAIRAGEEYASDLASTEYGNFFERLMRVAGLGGAATNTASSAASATGANVSNLLAQQGQARASGILGAVNSGTNAINSSLNAWLLSRGGYFGNPAPAAPSWNGVT